MAPPISTALSDLEIECSTALNALYRTLPITALYRTLPIYSLPVEIVSAVEHSPALTRTSYTTANTSIDVKRTVSGFQSRSLKYY